MILSKQLFQTRYRLNFDIKHCSLTQCLQLSPFVYFVNAGVPIFLSIGHKILERIENLCLTLAYKRDFNYLDLPTLIPTETLALGEDINPRFLDQFVFVKDRLKHFHLLSTPEPFLIYILKYGLESYRQLPMNIVFTQKFFRQLREVDGILKTREFKMLAALSLDDNKKSNQDKYEKFIDDIRDFFSLNLVVSKDVSSGFQEYFYIHNEGGDIYEGQKAVSIAMFYEYARNQKICSKYRNKHNKMIQPLLITFGLGIQRLFFAILDTVRDDLGFRFPKSIRPFNIMVYPSTDVNLGMANNIFLHISSLYSDILYDDRVQITIYEKCKLSDFLGIPIKILVTNEAVVLETRENPHFKQLLHIEDVFNTNILITTINKLLKD